MGTDEPPERPADPAVRRANLRRVASLFKPYRARLAAVLGLIVLSSAIGVSSVLVLPVGRFVICGAGGTLWTITLDVYAFPLTMTPSALCLEMALLPSIRSACSFKIPTPMRVVKL